MKKNKLLKAFLAGALAFTVAGEVLPQKAVEAKTYSEKSAVDYKNLADGVYSIHVDMLHYNQEDRPGKKSMSDKGVDKEKTRLVVKNGEYKVQITFKPIERGYQGKDFKGYLGNLSYLTNSGEFKQCNILEWYSPNDTDKFMDVYKAKFPDRTAYPKVLEYPVDKNNINNGKLLTTAQVFVPVMESILKNMGTQKVKPTYDFTTIKKVK